MPRTGENLRILLPNEVSTTRPEWERLCTSSTLGLQVPTQSETTARFSLFMRFLGNILEKAIITGQIVIREDLNGDMPSVLKDDARLF